MNPPRALDTTEFAVGDPQAVPLRLSPELQLRLAFRRMLSQHAAGLAGYTRALLARTPAAITLRSRLFALADQIAASFTPFYGPDWQAAAVQLTREYVLSLMAYATAQRGGEAQAAMLAATLADAQASKLAAVLAQFNPEQFLIVPTYRLLAEQVALVKAHANALARSDRPGAATLEGKLAASAEAIADHLARGLAAQFALA